MDSQSEVTVEETLPSAIDNNTADKGDNETNGRNDSVQCEQKNDEMVTNKEEEVNEDGSGDHQITTEDTNADVATDDKPVNLVKEVLIPDDDQEVDDSQEVIELDSDDKPKDDLPDILFIEESVRMSVDENVKMDDSEDTAATNGPTDDQRRAVNSGEETKADSNSNDYDLIVRGLKTSLMLSEEKNSKIEREKKEMEEELKKVYQHMFKCMEDKKTLQIKCQTLEEQLDKLVNSGGQKRAAQGSPSSAAKPTPPKKSQQINKRPNRPSFGRFGARYQDNGYNPPPFPGSQAPEFMPPSTSGRSPMGGFRGPTLQPNPDLMDTSLTDGQQVISTVGNRLQLPSSVMDRAVRIFNMCYDSPLRSMCRSQLEPMSTACLFIACREEHCPQTIKTMCTVAMVVHKHLEQCVSHIVDYLHRCSAEREEECDPSVGQVIGEFCQRSGFSRLIQAASIQIVKMSIAMKVLPPELELESVAAAALLLASMASDEHKPVFELSYITGVNDHQIRKIYNRLLPNGRQLFPSNFPFVTPPERLPLM